MLRRQDHAPVRARRRASPVEPGGFALAVLALRTENYREAETRLRDLLARAAAPAAAPVDGPPSGPSTRDAARLLAEALVLAGRHDDALAACAEARRHGWLDAGDPAADLLAGWVLLRRGQARPARDLAVRHLRDPRAVAPGHADDPPDPAARARLLHLRGMCDHRLGRPQAARRALRDAAALFRAADDPAGAAEALNALGVVEKTAVSLPAAAARFAEALRLNRAHGQPARCAQNMVNLAIVRLKSGQTAAALPALGEALALAEARNLTQTHLRARLVLARVRLQEGDPAAARTAAAAALADAVALGLAREQGLAHETLGDAAAAGDDLADARVDYARALAVVDATAPGGDLEAETLRRLGELDLRAGDPAAAVTTLRRAVRAARL
ncbi:MAG: tetratricopeptide repeat protein, partial [Candidatus Krumholzibacteriia bacterium]